MLLTLAGVALRGRTVEVVFADDLGEEYCFYTPVWESNCSWGGVLPGRGVQSSVPSSLVGRIGLIYGRFHATKRVWLSALYVVAGGWRVFVVDDGVLLRLALDIGPGKSPVERAEEDPSTFEVAEDRGWWSVGLDRVWMNPPGERRVNPSSNGYSKRPPPCFWGEPHVVPHVID